MPGHRPERTCVGCRAKRGKDELLRIALNAAQEATLDDGHLAPGRGVYLCRGTAAECAGAAKRRHALGRGLKVTEAAIDYEKLVSQIKELKPAEEEKPSPPSRN